MNEKSVLISNLQSELEDSNYELEQEKELSQDLQE